MSEDGSPQAKVFKKNLSDENNSTIGEQTFVAICETKLLDMNDDCLNELLSRLDVIDLSSIGQVCKQLKELAVSHFSCKYKVFDFSTLLSDGQLISNQETKNILNIFGPCIASMRIDRKSFQNHEIDGYVEEILLRDLAASCGTTLNSLELKNCHFTESAVESLNMLSDSLKVLSLGGSVVTKHCILYLPNFTSLKNLTISKTDNCTILMNTFPALMHLKLYHVFVRGGSEHILQHFIARHRELKTFEIISRISISSDLFPIFAKYTKSLKNVIFTSELALFDETGQFPNNSLYLSKLQNLRSLRLQCYSCSIGNLLTKMVSNKIAMEKLQLKKGKIDNDTIGAIIQMKDLSFIRFKEMIDLHDDHLIKIANELPKLHALHIFAAPNITPSAIKKVLRLTKRLTDFRIDKFCLDSKLYNEILDIVKERRNGTLKITIYSRDEQVFVPQETIRMNKNWILINCKAQV